MNAKEISAAAHELILAAQEIGEKHFTTDVLNSTLNLAVEFATRLIVATQSFAVIDGATNMSSEDALNAIVEQFKIRLFDCHEQMQSIDAELRSVYSTLQEKQ